MHHRPAAPPLTARITGEFARWGLLLGALLRVRRGRLLLAGVVTLGVTSLMLVLPVVSGLGAAREPLALDSSSSSTSASPSGDEGSPVVMGVDGRPIASSSYAGAVPSATTGDGVETAPGTTAPSEAADSPETAATTASGGLAQGAPSTGSPSAGSPSAGSPSAGSPSSGSPSSGGPSSGSPSSGAPSSPPAPVVPAPAPDELPAAAPPEEPAAIDAEGDLLALLDSARAGCAPLTPDGSLTAAARAHSAAMRDAGALVPLEGGPAGSTARGGTAAADALAGWLGDPIGAATILDCGLGSVGIGLVDGGNGPWWTLLLA